MPAYEERQISPYADRAWILTNGERRKHEHGTVESNAFGKRFIAALDQSGGSTPKALRLYGIAEDSYHGEEEMFDLVHSMRTRIMTSPAFTSEHILAAILFEKTMEREVEGKLTADYLWEEKHILPILKVDKGLAPVENGVTVHETHSGTG